MGKCYGETLWGGVKGTFMGNIMDECYGKI